MKCSICARPLLHCAVPGIAIGPTCAKRRGLAPERVPRVRLFDIRATEPTTHQIDWVNLINAGGFAGESATA
ncbi:MAG: hypothetical protein EOP39_04370 [Rubrivivax sp.]|nr:MAG: hypothetical protein EOP39_04370 [Rubrivivax sp.]